MTESRTEAIDRRVQAVLEGRRRANASGQDGEDVQHIRAAVWFDGPDADADEGDDFVDLDRTKHLFVAADGREWETCGGQYMYPPLPLGHWCLMVKEGKKAAGRLLDGLQHDEVPTPNHAA